MNEAGGQWRSAQDRPTASVDLLALIGNAGFQVLCMLIEGRVAMSGLASDYEVSDQFAGAYVAI